MCVRETPIAWNRSILIINLVKNDIWENIHYIVNISLDTLNKIIAIAIRDTWQLHSFLRVEIYYVLQYAVYFILFGTRQVVILRNKFGNTGSHAIIFTRNVIFEVSAIFLVLVALNRQIKSI